MNQFLKFRVACLLVLVFTLLVSCNTEPIPVEIFLETESFISEVKKIQGDTSYSGLYQVMIEQPIDHFNPGKGSFTQKIYLSHIDPDKPLVFVTEGYSAGRNYTSELARLIGANQIIVEHRYFGNSVPDSSIFDWQFLNTEQAANDHHRIVEMFKKVYPGKWINTGISKGGQTTMYHRYYFPEDVDVSVPYVGPLNFSIEDPRIYTFLDTVGSEDCRDRIYDFQLFMLQRRDVFYPWFLNASNSRGLEYSRITPEEAYEYNILEYDFAFWQWGRWSCNIIPGANATDEEVFQHFLSVCDLSYFADQGISYYEPFFYQALTEIGYYGYELDRFKNDLNYVTNPVFTFAAPQDVLLEDKTPILMNKVNDFLQKKGNNFIYIYGASDTWSATSVDIGNRTNALKIYKAGGAHGTRIRNLNEVQQAKVIAALEDWLNMDIQNIWIN